MERALRVAVIGAGPAGIYAADILTNEHPGASVDVLERLPAPYGLVRYGVAPDHPRIKEIIKALRRVLDKPSVRFVGNVEYGRDFTLGDLHRFYDVIIFATGAIEDRDLDIPGIELAGSHGAADFASWYTGHPDVPRDWVLDAQQVAVIGAGNVALDVARILAKPADEQLTTEIPDNVYRALADNKVTDVHVFSRRGPAHVKFSPLELRELSHSPSVDVLVPAEGFEIDDAGQEAIAKNKGQRTVVNTLLKYLENEPTGAPRRLHIHLCEAPIAVLGGTQVEGLRTERTEYLGDGSMRGTGEFTTWPVQAVYRAVGYRSTHLVDVPFDHEAFVIPNDAGRVLDAEGFHVRGVYATGWIKRGPVGLIGHTKSDAAETIGCLLDDVEKLPEPQHPHPSAILDFLAQGGCDPTLFEGWDRLDAHEMSLGQASGRERIKVVDRAEMMRIANGSVPLSE